MLGALRWHAPLFSLSHSQIMKSGGFEGKACLGVTSEAGAPPPPRRLLLPQPVLPGLPKIFLSGQNGFVLFNPSVPNHPSPFLIPSCSAAELGGGGGRVKPAMAFIINPFICKSPSPKKMHMLICVCNQLYSSFL